MVRFFSKVSLFFIVLFFLNEVRSQLSHCNKWKSSALSERSVSDVLSVRRSWNNTWELYL